MMTRTEALVILDRCAAEQAMAGCTGELADGSTAIPAYLKQDTACDEGASEAFTVLGEIEAIVHYTRFFETARAQMNAGVSGMDKVVGAALVLDRAGSLDWHVNLRPDQAHLFFVRDAQSANEYDSHAAASLIRRIDELVPRMQFGPGNPNNGNMHHTYNVGNEGSRVLYLVIRTTYLPKDFDLDSLLRRLEMAAGRAKADEFSHNLTEMELSVRFWWD